jgi:peptide subunit release factor 1 (eRF1)
VSPSSSKRKAVAAADSAVPALLDKLTRLKPGKHRIVSCYLKLEPRDRARGKYLIKLKNRAKGLLAGLSRLGLSKDVADGVTRDVHRIVQSLTVQTALPTTQGVAIFACEALGLFETCPLPMVHRSRLAIDTTPLVKELASIEDDFGRILAVITDRTSARFFEVTAFHAIELPGLSAASTRGGRFRGDNGSSGWGEHAYHNRIREEKQRHAEAVARELFAMDRRQPVHGIVLGGVGSEARLVVPFLHAYLAERVIGTLKMPPKEATAAEVHSAVLDLRATADREAERSLAGRVEELRGAGWAVNGIGATLKALARGQVRALLVNGDASETGFRATGTGRLGLTERDVRDEGTPEAVLDVVDEAIEDALRQHVDVTVLHDADASAAIDGLAGLLRFK